MLEKSDKKSKRFPIDEATPIQVGLVLILAAGFASWIWWAATINSKLDTVIKFQASQDVLVAGNAKDIAALRRDFEVFKASFKN